MKCSIRSFGVRRAILAVTVAGFAVGSVPVLAQERPKEAQADVAPGRPDRPLTEQDIGA
jgi:hypothetical protein